VVVKTSEALQNASPGLDLVEVAPMACLRSAKRIMDFGKFKYITSKREGQEAERRSTPSVIQVKEIKVREDEGRPEHKLKHIRRFLAEGDKVKVSWSGSAGGTRLRPRERLRGPEATSWRRSPTVAKVGVGSGRWKGRR